MGERVFARRYQPWDVTVGAVLGRDGVLVVDTRSGAAEAAALLDDLRSLDPRPPRWVVSTHDHFDHVGGNDRLRPAEVWAHPSVARPVPPATGPAPRDRYRGPIAVDRPVAARAAVDLGDRTVGLRHLGPAHTAGDLVVHVPDAGVVFAGDLVEEAGPPAYGDDCFPLDWPVAGARLLGLVSPDDRVVPGHGAVVDRGFLAEQTAAIAAVARTIRWLWVGEVPVERALAAGAGRWPLPEEALAHAVARGYRHLADDAR